MNLLLLNKKILITGIASKYSIAYGIAEIFYQQGAKLAFTYQHDKLKNRIKDIAKLFGSKIVLHCDVSKEENIKNLFFKLKSIWPKFDGFIHSIGFAPSDQLSGNYIDKVNQEGFTIAHVISSYSFVSMAKFSQDMLNKNSSLVTLSYLGAQKVVQNYNVMGLAKASLEANVKYMANSMGPKKIRVNGISSGPIKTLAASRIKDFKKMMHFYKDIAPLRRNVTIQDIGNVAAFFCSDFSCAITGEILYVDCGFNIVGIK